jgi:hypothetical protein
MSTNEPYEGIEESEYEFTRNLVAENIERVIENKTNKPAVYEGDAIIANEIKIEVGVIQHAIWQSGTWSQVIMRAMWNLVNKYDGAWQMIYQVNDLRGLLYKISPNADNFEYIPHVVERILPHAHEFDNPDTGKRLDADTLIDTPGLVKKLKVSSRHFHEATLAGDQARREEIIGNIMTKSASDVEATIKTYTNPEIKLPYAVQQNGSEEPLYRVLMNPDNDGWMSKQQFQLFRSALGKLGEEV